MNYMFTNHLLHNRNPDLGSKLGVGEHIHIDFEEELVTFYLYLLTGQLKGYQLYNWRATKDKRNTPREGRYYTYKEHPLACFGLHTYSPTKPLIFVEGVWEALAFHSIDVPCVAILSNSTKPFLNWMYSLPNKKIAAIQPDDASKHLRFGVDHCFFLERDADEYEKEDLEKATKPYLMGLGCG